MKYTTLLFDLDGTLYDFDANEHRSLIQVLSEFGVPPSPEHLDCYKRINHQLWSDYEKGRVTKQDIENTRFQLAFDELGMTADGLAASRAYRKKLMEGYDLIDGARELIDKLTGKAELDVITNGDAMTQRQRLEGADMRKYFTHVFISDAMGVQKPRKEYFDQVLSTIAEKDLRKILVIGDSLSSDILGGITAGLDTCWYNPKHLPSQSDIKPVWQIEQLHQLWDILQ